MTGQIDEGMLTVPRLIGCKVSYAHAILAWKPSFSVSSGGSVSFGELGIQRQVFNGTAFTIRY